MIASATLLFSLLFKTIWRWVLRWHAHRDRVHKGMATCVSA